MAGARLHDVVGRRKMLMGSTLGMTICLALVAAGAAGKVEYGNSAAATMSIVFIFLFGAVFATGEHIVSSFLARGQLTVSI